MEPGSNARAVTIIFTFVILRTSCGLSLPLQMFAWFGWQSDGPGQCQAQSSPRAHRWAAAAPTLSVILSFFVTIIFFLIIYHLIPPASAVC